MAVYRIIEKLGQGGMGVVYRAVQTNLDREVALKLLLNTAKDQKGAAARFAREVQASIRVSHPNVIRILDYGEIEGQLFYAMDYLPVPTLKDLLKKHFNLPILQVVELSKQLLDALSAIHRAGFIHRDLKPANLMVDSANHLTVMDFGLVKDPTRTALTRQGTIVGTPGYLSPESIVARRVDGRSDLFSAGVIIHECLAGEKPFSGDGLQETLKAIVQTQPKPLKDLRPDCPSWLAAIVDRLLRKDPADRFASAASALAAFKRSLDEQVEADEHAERVDAIQDSDAETVDMDGPVPRSSIQGGMRALTEAVTVEASPEPTAPSVPVRRTRQSRQVRRITATTPALPTPPRGRLVPAVAGLITALAVCAVVAIVRLDKVGPGPPAVPTVSSSPVAARPVPVDPVQLGRALERAIRIFGPEQKVDKLHRELRAVGARNWFLTRPKPEMIALRSAWSAQLVEEDSRTGLSRALLAFAREKVRFFTSAEVPAQDRLSVYLAIHDLVSFCNYAGQFEVPIPLTPSVALSDRYGQLGRAWLEGERAACLDLQLTKEHEEWGRRTRATVPPRYSVRSIAESERFHVSGDATVRELVETVHNYQTAHLTFADPVKLDLPLDRVEALELIVWVTDIHPTSCLVVAFSTDGKSFQKMAVIRGDWGGTPRPVYHSLERGLLHGRRLWVRVTAQFLPQTRVFHEYLQVQRLCVRYRLKGSQGRTEKGRDGHHARHSGDPSPTFPRKP